MSIPVIKVAKTSKDDKAAFLKAGISMDESTKRLTYKYLELSDTKAWIPFVEAVNEAVRELGNRFEAIKNPECRQNVMAAVDSMAAAMLKVADSVTLQADACRAASNLPFAAKKVTVATSEEIEESEEV